jgi:AcrR family transcriptional regulator
MMMANRIHPTAPAAQTAMAHGANAGVAQAASASSWRGPSRPYHHGDLRRELIQAGCTLLETKGLEGLTLRGLARQAGVSPAAPYHHFRDRAQVVAAVAEAGWVRLAAALAAARKAAHRRTLAAMAAAYVDFAVAHPALYTVMHQYARAGAGRSSTEVRGLGLACHEIRLALLARNESPHDESLEVTVAALWSAAHGIAELAANEGVLTGEAAARQPGLVKALLDHPFFGWNVEDPGGGGSGDGAI